MTRRRRFDRRPIREADKKIIAASLGCCPGASVPIYCDWCPREGRMEWVIRPMGDSSFIRLHDFEWDHYRAVALGGHSGIGNIWPICGPCNRKKSNKTVEEFQTELGWRT